MGKCFKDNLPTSQLNLILSNFPVWNITLQTLTEILECNKHNYWRGPNNEKGKTNEMEHKYDVIIRSVYQSVKKQLETGNKGIRIESSTPW